MSDLSTRGRARAVIAAAGLAVVASPLALVPAADAATGSHLVISEVYGGGGNTGAPYSNDFVELYNPTDAAVSVDGMSVQYRSANGTTVQVTALSGSVPAGGHYLVQEAAGSTVTDKPLPTPDATGTIAMSSSNGVVLLVPGTTPFTGSGDLAGDPGLVDMVGYGSTPTSYETTNTGVPLNNSTAATRDAAGGDTDQNAPDFDEAAPAPQSSGSGGPEEPPAPATATIEEIQGTGDTSPLAGRTVTTRGVVTASYPTGGFRGLYVQTPGTGGDVDPATHEASDALFVYLGGASASSYPEKGDFVEITGEVSEYRGLTEISPDAGGVTVLDEAAVAPKPAQVDYPGTDAGRESLEGMLLAPQGDWTVTDNYALNHYAEIGLATGTEPLRQPTDVARPGTPEADAVAADNAARAVTLDDGATVNFFYDQDVPLPYLTPDRPVRVGAAVTFTSPVVLDYRYDAWRFQPTSQLTADDAAGVLPVTFENTRTASPEDVGGALRIASFNVLNYFIETGEEYEADGGSCSYYTDRDGNRITVRSCNGEGPRGAANDVNLARQRAKIVEAINAMDADVLSLEEIENSAKYAGPARRDDALADLVSALNADAGAPVWDYVRSPEERPALADEDVIRTAFIYHRAAVEPVGASRILIGSEAFHNARKPLAQVFRARGAVSHRPFLVVVNHFKSKGSGVDDGTGQGNANPDRVAQARDLVDFVDEVKADADVEQVFLTGDFNAYTQEDPMQVLYDAGYTDIGSTMTDESTYLFDGLVGSLDHVLGNEKALRRVTGADVWNINSVEPVALEYSRYHYNATDFYEVSPFRSSDHDPLVVGYDPSAPSGQVKASAASAGSSR